MDYVVAILVGLVLAELATLITTVYLHRVLSHKSMELLPGLTFFMRIGTWMLTSISPREWVAVHRKHHNFSEVEGDPHSPHIEGYWKIMLANVYYYRRKATSDDTLQKYASDLCTNDERYGYRELEVKSAGDLQPGVQWGEPRARRAAPRAGRLRS